MKKNVNELAQEIRDQLQDFDIKDFNLKEFLNIVEEFQLSFETNKPKEYILDWNSINGNQLSSKIRDEDLHEYYIIDRLEFLQDLSRWIEEGKRKNSSDVHLMESDFEMLSELNDKFILSSNLTNSYISQNDENFNEVCAELLKINESLNK